MPFFASARDTTAGASGSWLPWHAKTLPCSACSGAIASSSRSGAPCDSIVRKSPVRKTRSGLAATARSAIRRSRATDMNGPRCGSEICTMRSGRVTPLVAPGMRAELGDRARSRGAWNDEIDVLALRRQRLAHSDGGERIRDPDAPRMPAERGDERPRKSEQRSRHEERRRPAHEEAVHEGPHARARQREEVHVDRDVKRREERRARVGTRA